MRAAFGFFPWHTLRATKDSLTLRTVGWKTGWGLTNLTSRHIQDPPEQVPQGAVLVQVLWKAKPMGSSACLLYACMGRAVCVHATTHLTSIHRTTQTQHVSWKPWPHRGCEWTTGDGGHACTGTLTACVAGVSHHRGSVLTSLSGSRDAGLTISST